MKDLFIPHPSDILNTHLNRNNLSPSRRRDRENLSPRHQREPSMPQPIRDNFTPQHQRGFSVESYSRAVSIPNTGNLYEPLRVKYKEIRLLTLNPGTFETPVSGTLETVSLNNNPTYEALSYVWGTEGSDLPIIIEDRPFFTTKNLLLALKYVRRRRRKRVLWIDAICINQTDMHERNSQVQLMRSIFNQSSRTVAWLGEAEEGLDPILFAFDFFSTFFGEQKFVSLHWSPLQVANVYTRFEHSGRGNIGKSPRLMFRRSLLSRLDNSFNSEMGRQIYKALDRFMDDEYWSRVWIIQEVALSRHLTLCRSFSRLDADIVFKAFALQEQHFRSACCRDFLAYRRSTQGERDFFRTGPAKFIFMGELRSKVLAGTFNGEDYSSLHRHFGHNKASNSFDHLYGLLGLTYRKFQEHIPVDYGLSMRELFVIVTSVSITLNGTLDVLKDNSEWKSTLPDLPTWAIDWSAAQQYRAQADELPILPSHRLFNLTQGRRMAFSTLTGNRAIVRGCRLSKISKVIPALPWKSRTSPYPPEEVELGHIALRAQLAGVDLEFEENCGHDCPTKNFWATLFEGIVPTVRENALIPGTIDDLQRLHHKEAHKLSLAWSAVHYEDDLLLRALKYIRWRSFFLLEDGQIGSGHSDAAANDWVAIIYGLDVPCILREVEGATDINGVMHPHFQFIGTAYVNRVMDGQAIDQVERGERMEETIVLV